MSRRGKQQGREDLVEEKKVRKDSGDNEASTGFQGMTWIEIDKARGAA